MLPSCIHHLYVHLYLYHICTNVKKKRKGLKRSRAPPPPPVRRPLLTQENNTLLVEDDHDAVLELGGEVEGEARPRQTGPGGRDLLQHVVHDVITARIVDFIATGQIHSSV